jgi:hypothetical protein
MIVHAGRQRLPLRRDAVDVASLVRRLDVVLLLAARGGTASAQAGITRFDVAATGGRRDASGVAAALGGAGSRRRPRPAEFHRRHWQACARSRSGLMVPGSFAEAVRGSKR